MLVAPRRPVVVEVVVAVAAHYQHTRRGTPACVGGAVVAVLVVVPAHAAWVVAAAVVAVSVVAVPVPVAAAWVVAASVVAVVVVPAAGVPVAGVPVPVPVATPPGTVV